MNFFSRIINWILIFWRNLSSAWHIIFSWTFIRIYLIVVFSLNIITWLAAIIIYKTLVQDLAVLHYNVDFGIDLIGTRSQLFVNPALGLIFALFDVVALLSLTKSRDFKFLAHLLLGAAALVNLLLALAMFSVYLINFR
jgi:hypothetical protein